MVWNGLLRPTRSVKFYIRCSHGQVFISTENLTLADRCQPLSLGYESNRCSKAPTPESHGVGNKVHMETVQQRRTEVNTIGETLVEGVGSAAYLSFPISQ